MFGAGLTTPSECLIEGLGAHRRPWLQKALVLSEHTPKEGDLRSGTRAGS